MFKEAFFKFEINFLKFLKSKKAPRNCVSNI